MTAIGRTPSGQPGVLPAGSIFQGGYEILAELGSGSFGRVYKARQLSTGQAVAIKVLRFWGDDTRADVTNQSERFRREMRLGAGLSHPNIVRLFDSGETEGGRLYAVFEYVPGSTLKEVLAREGCLGWGETVHLMTQVLDALSCAHARGVIHRDLKPENIMVTKTGARRNALVLDFGLGGLSRDARDWTLPRLTATCELMGTPCYAAPELEELDQLLHAQHALWAQLAARGGGVVAAAGGGSVLLAFGYPQAREDDARRAARAALGIAGEVERAKARIAAERGLRLEVRIGIHTGLVIVHEQRAGFHGEALDLVGVTPQVATRLQELAQSGEILASQDTQRLIGGALSMEPAGEHRLPELSRALPVFP